MCDDCGCEVEKENHLEEKKVVNVNKSINEINDHLAHCIWHALKDKDIFCINLLGSPGAGKTTVIEGLSKFISPSEIAVVQGDLESDIDKKRLEESGIYTYQINTHSGCHLNSDMVNKALISMNLEGKKYLIIENVGNLVCPAGVKIGQHMDCVVSSTTEGSDKPKKYPVIFIDASVVIISKSDLIDAVDFNEEMYLRDIKNINPKVRIVKTSKKDASSFKELAHVLEHKREHVLGHSHKH